MLDDQALYETQLAMALACGRSRSTLREKHKTRFCFMQSVLNVEAQNRGKPSPQPPYKA